MKELRTLILLFFIAFVIKNVPAQTDSTYEFHNWALTPPMGWNSWDCFGPSVVESEVKANADYMAANLLDYGWEYIVVDIRWYVDNQTTGTYNDYSESDFVIDEYGRYMPSPTRFPSAVDGAGFKPLADYVHNLGLKFGIHIMRGVPKEAVTNQLPIKGTSITADKIYSAESECTWLQDNYTVDTSKNGAQEYYNSILDLYASWGVDFIKVDDLSRPYHSGEIEMLRKAIDQTGRQIVLSMSPGATPLNQHEHANTHANMWRTIDDFWDNWSQLNYEFGICANWAPYISPGAWPDADMLPLGHLAIRGERGVDRYTNFTEDEQYTLMSLWTMFKSPLMFGGHMPDNDTFTTSLLTNEEVLYVHKASENNQQWSNENDVIAWVADDSANADKFVALFNIGDNGFVSTRNLLYRSGTVSRLTDGYGVDIDIDIPEGSDQLFLIVDDGGDDYTNDHADWINPVIYLSDGDSVLLTDLTWEYATAEWDEVLLNKSNSGGTLNIKGTTYETGIGTHAQSVILYQIPENTIRFKAFAGLDIGGTNQSGGATVEFMVSNADPTTRDVEVGNAIANTGRMSRTLYPEGKNIEADITGAEKLYLVVTDAGDNYNYDHADWINPAIYNASGDSVLLTSLDWESATSGWDEVQKNTSLNGNSLIVNGITYSNGFGVNSYSIIEYNLPEGYTSFKAFCGIDNEVLDAANGATVEFMVFTQDPSVLSSVSIPVDLTELGFEGECVIRDLWQKSDVGNFSGSEFSPEINTHGAGLYRISAIKSKEIECKLSVPDTDYQLGDSVTLQINVSKTCVDTHSVAGQALIYQNDSVLASVQIDSSGEVLYKTTSLSVGEYIFKSVYSGNTYYDSIESNQVIVVIERNQSDIIESKDQSDVRITKINGDTYLKGLKDRDMVSVYNMQGQILDSFVANSDTERIKGEGIVVLKVRSESGSSVFKALL